MTITAEQLARRPYYIGASDVSVLMGLNEWRSAYDLWLEKTQQKEPADLSDNDSIYCGNLLEPVAAQWYERETGRKVYEPEEEFRHPEYPFLVCHPDRLIADEDRGLEIKTTTSDRGWGQEGTDQIPLQYRLQCEASMLVTGIQIWDVALLKRGERAILEYKPYTVVGSPEIQQEILERALEFWDCVQRRVPPEGITLSDARERFRKSEQKEIYASEEIYECWQKLAAVKAAKKQAELDEEEFAGKLCNFMGDADTLVRDGNVIATWRNGSTFDYNRFREDHPDVYADYSVQRFDTTKFGKDCKALAKQYRIDGAGARVLRLKGE